VIAGGCEIGENCFLGINSTINDETKVAKDNWIASGSLIVKDTEKGKMYKGSPAKASSVDTYTYFNVEKESAYL
jgi:acetyltransferase-like isoleucine patch superfamily enzyme